MATDVAEVQKHLNRLEGGSRYTLESIIGKGSYGMVIQATDTETQERVAVKRVSQEIFQDSLLARRILREIKLLGHFDHENIIGLRNIIKPQNADFDVIYIVMDVMETDLKAIMKSNQPITESHVQYFIYQLLRGLDCVHKALVIHRDVTPSNILLNTNCDLKICDFGLAREENDGADMTDYVVMRWYRAPELVMEEKHYSNAVDVWGVGCIFAQLFHGLKPVFTGKDRINQLDVIMQVIGSPSDAEINKIGSPAAQKYIKRKPKCKGEDFTTYFRTPEGTPPSKDALDLLRKMLLFDPSSRITIHDALNHPYLADLHDPEDELQCQPPIFVFDDSGLQDVKVVKRAIYDTIIELHKKKQKKDDEGRKAKEGKATQLQNDESSVRTALQQEKEDHGGDEETFPES